MTTTAPLILGSGSAIRAQILRSCGLAFHVRKSGVDEGAIKDELAAQGAEGEAVALALAEAKALAVDAPADAVVIGADQILRLDGALLDKVASMEAARDRLVAMRGKAHELVGGMVLARGGSIIARHTTVSTIHVRDFSNAFLDAYLAEAGEAILASVACYQFEGLGAQLFEAVEGDYYAILGLPLVPLLQALREVGAAPV